MTYNLPGAGAAENRAAPQHCLKAIYFRTFYYLTQLVCKEGVNVVGVVEQRHVCARQEAGGYRKAVELGRLLKNILKLGKRLHGGGNSRRQDFTKQSPLIGNLKVGTLLKTEPIFFVIPTSSERQTQKLKYFSRRKEHHGD